MLKTIVHFLEMILSIIVSLVRFVCELLSNLVYMVSLLKSVSLSFLGYFSWLPETCVVLIGVGLTVVIVYKFLGREG